jgi:hypothetical protein
VKTNDRGGRPLWLQVELDAGLDEWRRSIEFTLAELEAHRARAEALIAELARHRSFASEGRGTGSADYVLRTLRVGTVLLWRAARWVASFKAGERR